LRSWYEVEPAEISGDYALGPWPFLACLARNLGVGMIGSSPYTVNLAQRYHRAYWDLHVAETRLSAAIDYTDPSNPVGDTQLTELQDERDAKLREKNDVQAEVAATLTAGVGAAALAAMKCATGAWIPLW
jgi:hypothetical protein